MRGSSSDAGKSSLMGGIAQSALKFCIAVEGVGRGRRVDATVIEHRPRILSISQGDMAQKLTFHCRFKIGELSQPLGTGRKQEVVSIGSGFDE